MVTDTLLTEDIGSEPFPQQLQRRFSSMVEHMEVTKPTFFLQTRYPSALFLSRSVFSIKLQINLASLPRAAAPPAFPYRLSYKSWKDPTTPKLVWAPGGPTNRAPSRASPRTELSGQRPPARPRLPGWAPPRSARPPPPGAGRAPAPHAPSLVWALVICRSQSAAFSFSRAMIWRLRSHREMWRPSKVTVS